MSIKFSDIQNILGSLHTTHQILGQIIQDNRDENSTEQNPIITNLITAFNNTYDVINYFENILVIIQSEENENPSPENIPLPSDDPSEDEEDDDQNDTENDIKDPIVLKGRFKHLGIIRDVKDAYRIIGENMEKYQVALQKLDTAMDVLSLYNKEDFSKTGMNENDENSPTGMNDEPPQYETEEEEEEEKHDEKPPEEKPYEIPQYQSLLEEEEEEEEKHEQNDKKEMTKKLISQRGKPRLPSSDSTSEEEYEQNKENDSESEFEIPIDSDEDETEDDDDEPDHSEELTEKSRTNQKFFLGFINKKYGVNTYQTVYKPKKKILELLDQLLQSKDFKNNPSLLKIQQILNEKVFNENSLYKRINQAIKIFRTNFADKDIKKYILLSQLRTELDKIHDAVKNLPEFNPNEIVDEKVKTQSNTKMHLGFINRKYGINVYRPIYQAKKSIMIAMDKLFKDKKYSNDQFMKEVNRLVNVETKDEETLLANIQQAQNVLFTRYKKNQINSNDDLSEIAYQINVFIKCLQTLPTEEEDEE